MNIRELMMHLRTMDQERHVEVQARLDCNCRTAIFDVESVEFDGRNCTIHVSEL